MRLPNPPPQLRAPVAPAEGPRDTRLQPRTQSCGPGASRTAPAGSGGWELAGESRAPPGTGRGANQGEEWMGRAGPTLRAA